MTSDSLQVSPQMNIWGVIEQIWDKASAWPEFIEAMRLALNSGRNKQELSIWAELPGLCCQAAGGLPRTADPVAAAWLLFYTAASIMDHVEDAEQPDPWWADLGAGAAINVATGLYFSACLLLSELDSWLGDHEAASQIRSQVLGRFLVMCSGQHLDLIRPSPTLDQYWDLARAKSGAFFTFACWAGALSTCSPSSKNTARWHWKVCSAPAQAGRQKSAWSLCWTILRLICKIGHYQPSSPA